MTQYAQGLEWKSSLPFQALCVSASDAGRFYLLAQTLSLRFWLTGKLTGKPKDNVRFSTIIMEFEVGI
jgi:hypothetical protein